MRTLLALVTVAVTSVVGAAYAADPAQDNAAKRAIPVAQLKSGIDQMGYNVRRVKKDNGAYDVYLVDRETGGNVLARFDARTGELTRASLLYTRRWGHEREEEDERHEDHD